MRRPLSRGPTFTAVLIMSDLVPMYPSEPDSNRASHLLSSKPAEQPLPRRLIERSAVLAGFESLDALDLRSTFQTIDTHQLLPKALRARSKQGPHLVRQP